MFHRNPVSQTLLAAVFAAAIAHAHSAGTTQSSSGVPGEGDCTACHTVGPIGTGGVAAVFSDKTGTYQAGVSQHMTVTITDSTAKRWGFQLTARLQSNQQLQAGSFNPGTDSQLFCTNIGGVNYSQGTTCPTQQPLIFAEQTFDGTHINKTTAVGSITYELDWIPPTDPNAGTVVMYISGLASNNDGAVAGDITYNVRYVIQPAVVPNLPVITSVLNPSGVQSTITQGEIISIRGTGLTTTSRPIDSSELINGQYPSTADGVQVTIAGVPAYLLALDPSRIRAVVPKTDALGLVPVIVNNGTQTTLPFYADLEPVAPAFFLFNSTYVMAQHLDGTAVAPVGSLAGQTSSSAAPGETIVLTVVGLGPTDPSIDPGIPVPDGTVANLKTTPLVLFNGNGVLAQSATLITGVTGVFSVTVQVPSDAPNGDMPIQIQVNGVQSDPGFFLPIKR
jgi:uncharacterized protein (TIGR03437 family)